MPVNNYKYKLLSAWEDVYKKGQLTLWILLALKTKPRYVEEIKEFIETKTNKTFTCEEQSLYRSLRKFYDLEMVDFENQTGNKGPERKYYFLTPLGKEILKEFIERNIALFYKEEIKKLILE
jgi:DNA-binding PadR family transcriptional regulator